MKRDADSDEAFAGAYQDLGEAYRVV